MWKPDPLRKLARNARWMTLYSRAKDMNINLFENRSDFSDIQIIFLQWLETYHYLYTELASQDNKSKLSRRIIEDEIFCDAYLVYDRDIIRKKDGENNLNKIDKVEAMKNINPDLPPRISFKPGI